jgi:hypothetical protein
MKSVQDLLRVVREDISPPNVNTAASRRFHHQFNDLVRFAHDQRLVVMEPSNRCGYRLTEKGRFALEGND